MNSQRDVRPPANPEASSSDPTELFLGLPSPPTVVPGLTVREGQGAVDAGHLEPSPRTPRRFGKYEILEKIGAGGMGIVYKARDIELDRLVALKTIRAGVLAESDEIERFRREGRTVAHVHDPHIITIYDCGIHEGAPYFVMELLPGETLAQKVEYFSQAPPVEAVKMIEIVARALHVAHQRMIIHRDIKPGNILLDAQGEPKLSDFGLAKLLDAETELTQGNHAPGTPAYMSPEQTAGLKEKLQPATDVWALGVVLFELLTGKRPFAGKSPDELKSNIRTAYPEMPRQSRRDLSKELEAVVLKCLEKDPARRYPSALALAEDLARWQRGESTKALPLTLAEKSWRKFRSNWKIAVAITGVLCLIWATWAIYRSPLRDLERTQNPAVNENKWESDILRELKEQKTATLVGATGGPKGFRWIFGEKFAGAEVGPNGHFWVSSNDLALMELLSEVPENGFRLEAELLHDLASHDVGEVGLFVSHQVRVVGTKGHASRQLIKLTFNDYPGKKLGDGVKGHQRFKPVLYADSERGEAQNILGGLRQTDLPAKGAWRKLLIDANLQKVTGSIDGWQTNLEWAELNRQTNQVVQTLQKSQGLFEFVKGDLSFDQRGGIGIYVSFGSCYVRNVNLSANKLN